MLSLQHYPNEIVNLCNVPYVPIITHTLYFVNTKN
nr:MAG TPA: hypothetical protein [Bacteriophage sp.]DAU66568.1 MAG TPA: hypothetical protein [Caudoviricetes sp.]